MSLDIKYSHPGELLKEKRLSKNLSLRGLSVKAGISHTEISKVESGERESPSYNTVFKICNALDLEVNDIAALFNIEEIPTEKPTIKAVNSASSFAERRILLSKCTSSFLNIICEELSKKYDMYMTPDMFKERYRVSDRSTIPHLCFTENDMVIGVDVKFMPFRPSPHHLHMVQSTKSCFADFYFNFRGSFSEDKMLFFACFINESDDSYDLFFSNYKDEFYKFRPILSTRLYNVDDLLGYL